MKYKYLTVRLEDIKDIISRIYLQIEEDQFKPEAIVYVGEAPTLLAYELNKYFSIPMYRIEARRAGTRLEEISKLILPPILKYLPRTLRDIIRTIKESTLDSYRTNAQVLVYFKNRADLHGKRILLLDDAIDTGNTIARCKEYLAKFDKINSMKIAVVTVTRKNPIILPDYKVYSEICQFPWSVDSEQIDEYKKLYENTTR